MPTNMTTKRPADLADYAAPPLTEVVLGVQFNTLERFLSPHIGLVWERFKSNFPNIEEHPPLPPTFETFGTHPQFAAANLQISMGGDTPRVFFINADRTQLLQVQKDRFLHNWRKIASGEDYPRFERMLESFEQGLKMFADVVSREHLGAVVPNQCEVSYINQIPVPADATLNSVVGKVFARHTEKMMLGSLGSPEDLRFLLRYVIRDSGGAPLGRVIVSADPARRADGVTIIQLTLTARGKPLVPDFNGVNEFLKRGRMHLIEAFTELTSAEMHREWGRIQ
jgi:uncharacterized protein (TIGR04255 family)